MAASWQRLGDAAGCVGIGVNRVRIDSGRLSTPPHSHGASEEIVFVLGGSGFSWQDEQVYELRPGDCAVHLADHEEHTLRGGPDGLDVLIYGTGFQASDFLTPMRVVGRSGVELHEQWAGEARAYLGVTVPDFPNLFCLYGPNTNIVINGSIIYFSECGVGYILDCLRLLLEGRHGSLDLRPEVHESFNDEVDRANRQMAWGASTVNSWYKNASGRVTQNWPFTLLEYWQRTLAPDPAEYEFLD